MKHTNTSLNIGRFYAPLALLLVAVLMGMLVGACTDERTIPAAPEQGSYTETKTVISDRSTGIREAAGSFTLRSGARVVSAFLNLTCLLEADSDLVAFESYGTETEQYRAANDLLEVSIINYQLQDTLSEADSLDLANLLVLKQANLDSMAVRTAKRDSLDTFLDDRYSVEVWLDTSSVRYYPGAIFLNSTALRYLADSSAVWGQGFFLGPRVLYTDPGPVYLGGKTLKLDLKEFWVADGGWGDPGGPYYHPRKPARVALTDQFPIRDWLELFNAQPVHTLHVRFGAPGTQTRVIASLYLVYDKEG